MNDTLDDFILYKKKKLKIRVILSLPFNEIHNADWARYWHFALHNGPIINSLHFMNAITNMLIAQLQIG